MMGQRSRLRRLVVATDFSAGGGDAVARALRLPLAPGAEIILLHVVPHQWSASAEERHVANSRASLDRALPTARDLLETSGQRATVTAEVVRGTPHVEIVRRAQSLDAELIVVGRHGKRRLVDPFVGSTATRIVHSGDCPVLLVAGPPERAYQRPLLATDLEDSAHRLVRLASNVLDEDVELRVVHTVTTDDIGTPLARAELARASGRMDRFLEAERRRIRISGRVRTGGVAWAILEEAKSTAADLLLLGTYAESFVARALLGSSNDQVIAHAPCDVLVGPPVRRLHVDLASSPARARVTGHGRRP